MWVSLCLGATRGGEEEAELREQVFLLGLERKNSESSDYFMCASSRAKITAFFAKIAKVRESYASRTRTL